MITYKKILITSLSVLSLLVTVGCGNSQSPTPPEATPTSTTISVMVVPDLEKYQAAMREYYVSSATIPNPGKTWGFEKKEMTIPYTPNPAQSAAEYAAGELPSQAKAYVIYFKIKDGIAYVVTNIHVDGWAGVSMTIAAMEPLIERTLLQYPEIQKVVFDLAPGDSKEDLLNKASSL